MPMKLFISWSGERSKKLAQGMRNWIQKVIQDVEPWMSEEDIEKGSNWLLELARQLDDTHFGLICVTHENPKEPWLIFEAGALSKKVEQARVCPYLLDIKPSEIEGPLAQFQATKAEKEESRKLLHSINKAVEQIGGRSLKENDLDEAVNIWWPKLEEQIKAIGPPTTAAPPKRAERDILDEILRAVRSLERNSAAQFPTFQRLKELMGLETSDVSKIAGTLGEVAQRVAREREKK